MYMKPARRGSAFVGVCMSARCGGSVYICAQLATTCVCAYLGCACRVVPLGEHGPVFP